ncbi:hypothetical protein LXL04_019173 [Taraxacum kok-saghyz]
MSDSVRGPRRLIGEFDVGLGPWSMVRVSLMEVVQHLKIPFEDINLATNNFSDENCIGKGGYGTVYAAKLSLSGQQRTVAIKRLNGTSDQGEREFLMEIQLLSSYRHKNLISLVGFCDESGEKILVYEYANHGSLDKYLCTSELSWMQRLQISLGAARGFNYLHNDVGPQHRVLHRDIKSSNILLDENWEAKISDFGLSKIGPSNVEFTFLLTRACGTLGYVDPEYLKTGMLTKESDVYSFGVVLFEILCGRLSRTTYQNQSHFLSLLAPKCYQENKLVDIINPTLRTQMKVDSLDMFSMVAYQCLKENRTERPTMAWIAEKLEKALELQAGRKVARFIRIGTWGRQGGDPQEYWSFQLEQDENLSKITIGHGASIYSLTFDGKCKGIPTTSKTVGGNCANGHSVSEVVGESRSFLHRKVSGWASGHKVSKITLDDDEQIISMVGSIGTRDGSKTISSLCFITNKRTHGPFGKAAENEFSVPWEVGSLVGFYGLAGNYIDSIGVFVKAYDQQIIRVGTWGKTEGVGPQNLWSFELEKNHHLKKISINHGDLIYSLMFTTEYRGLLHNSRLAGGWKLGETASEVRFDWDEEIHTINGTIGISRGDDPGCVVITSISFVTNKRTHGHFGNKRGRPFTVSWDDCSFVGFYGAAVWGKIARIKDDLLKFDLDLQELMYVANNHGETGDGNWVWSLNANMEFSTKSLREAIDSKYLISGTLPSWWSSLVPIKINVFSWRVCLGRLATRTNLSKRGLIIQNNLCPWCNIAEETEDHLFIHCSTAKELQATLITWWGNTRTFTGATQVQDLFVGEASSSPQFNTAKRAYLWALWKYRNDYVFMGKIKCNKQLMFDVKLFSFNWMSTRGRKICKVQSQQAVVMMSMKSEFQESSGIDILIRICTKYVTDIAAKSFMMFCVFKVALLATNNFSDENSIGKGGYGKVYAAKLSLSGQQRTVAIKRLNLTSVQGEREFLMEIQLLSCYRHKNLVLLVGFCDENKEKILVYEYAKHGSLDKYLSSFELSWTKRLQISIGAARGFSYLHNDVGPQHRVLHRDIKSSNILLDDDWEAKISDFGLSKIGPSNVECTFLLTNACGTIGYVDPEYARTGILTKESDVYSFGVVLFEILCGRPVRNKDKTLFLPTLARKHYEQNTLNDIVHPNLKTQVKVDSMEMFSMVAYQCLKENRSERPTMTWILEKLEKALELQAFLGFEKMPASWTDEEKEIKDLKALSQIRLHLSNDALDSKEKMKHITGSRDASAEGLQARGYKASGRERYPQPSSEANSKSDGRRKFCNYCQKKGHKIEDCFKLRNKIAEKDKLDGHNQASASGESDVAKPGLLKKSEVSIIVRMNNGEVRRLVRSGQHNKRLFSAFVNGVALRKRRFVVPSKKDYCVRLDNSLYCLKLSPRHVSLMEVVQHLKIPFEDINLATNNFSDENCIGKGGYGTVYAAKLSLSGQQRTVAIKRLNGTSDQGEREFLMEIQLLSSYRHKNLISLVGFCDESGEKILVYEYANHGSLDKYLCTSELSWMQRLQISLGAARGFNYLHNDVGPQHRVLHRDIKSSNILLDENWEAKISDFGLSKIGPSNVEFTFLLTRACGTLGYVDPEYLKTGMLTKESDVYSFGVVLFEILCGRLSRTTYQNQSHFLSLLAPKCYQENKLVDIINPTLRTQMKVDSLDMFSMVAYQCLKENRTERPTMAWIAEKLEKALELQAGRKVARFIRIGTWGRQGGDPQEYWSFQLEQDENLSKITIGHGASIYSLTFDGKCKGIPTTSKTVGGNWANGHSVSEVVGESRSFLHRKVSGWASGHKVSKITLDDDEQIISMVGSIGTRDGSKTISSLCFITNKRTHGPFGKAAENEFSVPWEVGSLVGFYGLAGNYIDSIGVFVKAYDQQIIRVGTWGKTEGVGPQNLWSFELEKNHHLKKISINHGDLIYSLMFTTEYRGLLHNSRLAGGWKLGETASEVRFDWDEEIHTINGTIGISRGDDPGCVVITSISFVTNKRTHGHFGNKRGRPFTVSWDDCSFVGFYGAAGWYIDKIGVYLKATT